MSDLHQVKLHDVLKPNGNAAIEIHRAPGGWIYRFFELGQTMGTSGIWAENYRINSVFVPWNDEFGD